MKSEENKYHHSFVESNFLKNDTNELIHKTETDIQISKNKLRLPKGKYVGGRGKSGAWDEHIHTTTYKMDNQQQLTIYYRELCSILCDNLYEKRILKK